MWYFDNFSRKGSSFWGGRAKGAGGSVEGGADGFEEVLLKVLLDFTLGGILPASNTQMR